MHEGNQTLFIYCFNFLFFFVELSNCKDTNQDFIYIIILIKSIVEIRWTNNIFMPSYFYFWIIENRHFPLLADFCATFGHQWVCKLHNCNIFDRWWQIFNHKIKLVKQAGSQCTGEDVYGGTCSTVSIERDASIILTPYHHEPTIIACLLLKYIKYKSELLNKGLRGYNRKSFGMARRKFYYRQQKFMIYVFRPRGIWANSKLLIVIS